MAETRQQYFNLYRRKNPDGTVSDPGSFISLLPSEAKQWVSALDGGEVQREGYESLIPAETYALMQQQYAAGQLCTTCSLRLPPDRNGEREQERRSMSPCSRCKAPHLDRTVGMTVR